MPGKKVTVVGGGLAGSEAVWYLANKGFEVVLFEQRPVKKTSVHRTGRFAELVCSNSLKSEHLDTPSGVLKVEMCALGSLILKAAQKARLPGGKSLVVDREKFAWEVTRAIEALDNVKIFREEVKEIPDPPVIIATGPLTSGEFAESLKKLLGRDFLYYYDAVAPIVDAESIDYSRAFWGSRYSEGDDYLNCPLTYEEYRKLIEALLEAETVPVEGPDKDIQFFESCLPVEEMARRGFDTLAYGPMRPVGLKVPEGTYAVVQLRREDLPGRAFSLVGFQTRLKWGEQERVFRLIPCLRNAEFLRYGVVHRNTYVLGPAVLERDLKVKTMGELIFIAGQLTGVEGYLESAMAGIVAARALERRLERGEPFIMPDSTLSGALLKYVTASEPGRFVPMNVNFGLLPGVAPQEITAGDAKETADFVANLLMEYGVPLDKVNFKKVFEEVYSFLSAISECENSPAGRPRLRLPKRTRRILKALNAFKQLKSFLQNVV